MYKTRDRSIRIYIRFLLIGMIIGVTIGIWIEKSRISSVEDSLTKRDTEINVKIFGAVPNDNLDDTQSIQNAINSLSVNNGGTIIFHKGIYLIDALKSIQLKQHITLKFDKGAVLKALTNSAERYAILNIKDTSNVSILGNVTIIGDRKEHLGTTGQWGHCISITGSKNVYIENPIIQDCWGDGIYVGSTKKQNYNKHILIKNAELSNNRRQGISIISAIDLKLVNPTITNTNGNPPSAGIDIEPNNVNEHLRDILINKLQTNSNKGHGLIISLKRLKGSNQPVGIIVNESQDITDGYVVYEKALEHIKGTIKIGNKYFLNKK